MKFAYQGIWPTYDADGVSYDTYHEGSFERKKSGTSLAGGYFLVPWSLKGDLDYFYKCLGLRHYVRNRFCEPCKSHSDPSEYSMAWTNVASDAAWKSALFSVTE